jgi:IS30 family transposase
MAKASNKTADLVSHAIIKTLTPFEAKFKRLTCLNDKEFFGHALIDDAVKSTGYFIMPFASWERGSGEHFNGLLRQYTPKRRPMKNINDEKIKMIENRLNNLPANRWHL